MGAQRLKGRGMPGSDIGPARPALAGLPAVTWAACSRGPLEPGSERGSAAANCGPDAAGVVAPPTVVDSGFGALPWTGVLSGGPIGTPQFYDHTAEAATARGYGRATPFEPPGFPNAFPAYPAPGGGYSGRSR